MFFLNLNKIYYQNLHILFYNIRIINNKYLGVSILAKKLKKYDLMIKIQLCIHSLDIFFIFINFIIFFIKF